VFAWLLVAAAGVVALDACVLLAGAGHRPVMPAALVTSVVLPLTVMFDPRSGPGRVPAWLAAGTLAAFGLVIVSPRRRGIGVALGVTLLAALLVGLGTSLLLGLRGLPDGFRWVLGFLLLTLVAELAGLLPATLARRRASRPPVGQRATAARAAAAASVAITALVLAVVLDPPFSPEAGGLLGVVAWTASLLAAGLGRMLSAKPAPAGGPAPAAAGGPAPAGPGSRPSALGGRGSRRTSGIDRGLGSGRLLRLAGAVLLGSPVAYLVVAHVLAPAAG
jgi:hypothetical protein